MQSCSGVSDRMAAGLARMFREKLGILRAFDYKAIERSRPPRARSRNCSGGTYTASGGPGT
ncbi:MAG: hypothetical protein JRN51_03385 [Nitrososphaerota archaeon]|nr:hypothetical protein [Nitrososphaerota archaeon]MDG7030684.1 hypothetical protein [Nitrososphaerota archaeon]